MLPSACCFPRLLRFAAAWTGIHGSLAGAGLLAPWLPPPLLTAGALALPCAGVPVTNVIDQLNELVGDQLIGKVRGWCVGGVAGGL